ncbi:MAG: PTS transporter subunit EIIC, partial [Clostridia bacterium]|nr:PTS transporter subunit EIIC [Clostridia bacterium]
MKQQAGFFELIRKAEQSIIVRAVRSGLVNMIPVLTIGAFALIGKTLPISFYQSFITSFASGFIVSFFDLIFSATFGVLSVYMTFSISRAYMKIVSDQKAFSVGAILSALTSFFILAGAYLPTFSLDNMGPKSMFLAIITGLGASALYLAFDRLFRKRKHYLFSAGADNEFHRMLSSFFPTLCVTVCFALFNHLIMTIFGTDSFRTMLAEGFDAMFANIPNGFFKGFFFVFLSSFLWFFGVHGSDTLEGVMQAHFAPNLIINQAGGAEVLTKEFFDCFVLMGGCGSAICLLIAILIFSRNRAHRGLGYTAAFPMLFNINELMVFGLPVILNPIMLIPFLLVPLVCYSLTYLAIAVGIVPVITAQVEWTTPIILGGYTATGSFTGALLQVINVAVGVAIYLPFVKLLDKRSAESVERNYESFIRYFRDNEAELTTVKLTTLSNTNGDIAKTLCADIKHSLKNKAVLAYQPQYDFDGNCIGVEALLRYRHPVHGLVYPPLVIKLAEEGGFLADLEEAVLYSAIEDRPKIINRFGKDVKLSVNMTGTTVVTQRYLQFVKKLNEEK